MKRICNFDGCEKPYRARGYCAAHHKQLLSGKPLKPLRKIGVFKECEFPGCDRKQKSKSYCNTHYSQLLKGRELSVLVPIYKYPKDWKLTQESLKELIYCDPDDGIPYWKVNTKMNGGDVRNKPAGIINHQGYRTIGIHRKRYMWHRLMFLYMNGQVIPHKLHVHHKNGIRDDNRWGNLEIVTSMENNESRGNNIIEYKDGTWGYVKTVRGFKSREEAVKAYNNG